MKHLSFFILILLLVIMIGCKTMQPTIGTTTKNDSISVRTEFVHDTTYIEKTREVTKTSDTIRIYDSIVIYKFRDRVKTDTLLRYHSDTTQVVQYVEKPIAPFVRNSCIALWIIIGVAILVLGSWIALKFYTGNFSFGKIFSLLRK